MGRLYSVCALQGVLKLARAHDDDDDDDNDSDDDDDDYDDDDVPYGSVSRYRQPCKRVLLRALANTVVYIYIYKHKHKHPVDRIGPVQKMESGWLALHQVNALRRTRGNMQAAISLQNFQFKYHEKTTVVVS